MSEHSEFPTFEERLISLRTRVAQACDRADRLVSSVEWVAVSKNHPAESVELALEHGLTCFGESKVQEARTKIPSCPPRAIWHLIGHLQTNKARDAVRLFSMIQSVDSLKLARELQDQAEKQSRSSLPVLLEVNVAGESTKYGFSAKEVLTHLEELNDLDRLEIHGFMTIAPWSPDPERSRPFFQSLRETRDRCEQSMGVPFPVLSMGMSGDFETAIEEGSTMIRLGTALFGARPRTK